MRESDGETRGCETLIRRPASCLRWTPSASKENATFRYPTNCNTRLGEHSFVQIHQSSSYSYYWIFQRALVHFV